MDTGRNNRGLSTAEVEALDDLTDVSVAPAPPGAATETVAALPDDTPAPPPVAREADLAAGTRLGEYQIESKIGEGGMGVVYSAVHPLIGKRAAVKVLRKELCTETATVQRFVDEARVVNQIGHPNIVDIFAFGEMPDGRSYFVMEWLRGRSLRDRMNAGVVPLPEICAVVKPLCRALEAAHEKDIIHRDLKPDNIFVVDVRNEAPTIKLLDFGIAKLVRSDRRLEKTATGAMIGTPQYIAPEQARGYAIDHRVDTYALGGIIFELVTGRPPFVADNAMDMVAKHLLEEPQHLRALKPDTPVELDALVFRMLAKDPNRRPPVSEVYEVFDRLANGLRSASATEMIGRAWISQSSPVLQNSPLVAPESMPYVVVPAAPTVPAVPRVPTELVDTPARRSWLVPVIVGLAMLLVGGTVFVLVSKLGGGGATDTPRVPAAAPVVKMQPQPPPQPPPTSTTVTPITTPIDAGVTAEPPVVDAATLAVTPKPTTTPPKTPPHTTTTHAPKTPPTPPKEDKKSVLGGVGMDDLAAPTKP